MSRTVAQPHQRAAASRPAPDRRAERRDRAVSSPACWAAPRTSGRTSSPRNGRTLSRAGAGALQRPRRTPTAAASRRAPWGRSIARADQKIYLDTSFFEQIATRFRGCDAGSKSCQFAQAYVIAHEVGHHVQNLLGILPKAQQLQRAAGSKAEANQHPGAGRAAGRLPRRRLGDHENESLRDQGKPAIIEPGDIEAALRTAAAIGDDTLQKTRAGLRGARQLHPRHVRAAPALVRRRAQERAACRAATRSRTAQRLTTARFMTLIHARHRRDAGSSSRSRSRC